jgi:LytS/YehU family sensor histidine kinase
VWAAVVVMFVSISLHEWMRRELEAKLRLVERDEAIARRLAAEAQLAALESRVRPHFLFNALNSIAALIPTDPSRAERVVGQIASLLRFSLDSADARLVPLSDELHLVADYLEVERVRFRDRLRYQLDVDESAARIPVPCMSVQTLVENAVKYAVSPRRDGGSIVVHGGCSGGRARISVCDDGPGFEESAIREGHGLALVRARLQLLLGESARLHIESRPGMTCVVIEIG